MLQLLIIILSILLILTFLLGGLPSYLTHIFQVKGNCDKYIYSNFKKFIKYYNKVEWQREEFWKFSYFGVKDEYWINYIHADVIKIGNVGIILYPIDYIIFKIWEYKNRYKGEI